MAKSSTCEMGMQVSYCYPAEISKKSPIWSNSQKDRRNPSRTMSAQGVGLGRGQSVTRPYPHAFDHAAEIQPSDDHRVLEIEECDSNPSRGFENERNAVWAFVLGTRLLCQHSGLR